MTFGLINLNAGVYLIQRDQLLIKKNSQMIKKDKEDRHRYNKVNMQKKFQLLNLIYKQNVCIREAAKIAGINHLTAKTIVFFNKNNYKSYQFDLNLPEEKAIKKPAPLTATVSYVRKYTELNEKIYKPKTRIQVICSIGNILSPPHQGQTHTHFKALKESELHEKLNQNQCQLPRSLSTNDLHLNVDQATIFPLKKHNLTASFNAIQQVDNNFIGIQRPEEL